MSIVLGARAKRNKQNRSMEGRHSKISGSYRVLRAIGCPGSCEAT